MSLKSRLAAALFCAVTLTGAVALTGTGAARAATTIDFTAFEAGIVDGPLRTEGVTLTSSSGQFSIIDSYYEDSNRFCARDSIGFFIGCIADWRAAFDAPVRDLSIRAAGQSGTDRAILAAFDETGTALGSRVVDENGVYDFGALADISLLALINLDTGGRGMSFTDLSFDVAPVPLPAGLPLVLTGLGALSLLRRRRA